MIPIVLAPSLVMPHSHFSDHGEARHWDGWRRWAGVIGLWVFWDFTVLALLALIFVKIMPGHP